MQYHRLVRLKKGHMHHLRSLEAPLFLHGPLIQLSRELLPCELEMFSIALQHWVNKYTFVTQQLGMMVMT